MVHALAPGEVVLVTRNVDGTHASGNAQYASISTAGKCVTFASSSLTLPGATGDRQIYVRNIDAGTTTLVSDDAAAGTGGGDGVSSFPVITPDCRYVAFESDATDLTSVALAQHHVYRRDLQTGTTSLISRATTAAGAPGDRPAIVPSISDDGDRVSFASTSTNFSAEDSDGALHEDVFVRKVALSETVLASRNEAGAAQDSAGGAGFYTDISGDGKKVAFQSFSDNMSTEDDDDAGDVFVRDIDAGTTVLASRANGLPGAAADDTSADPSLSADGSKVLFLTSADNLGAVGDQQIVLRDVTAGTTQVVSRASGAAGSVANGLTGGDVAQFLSSDGQRVAFWSQATNLDPSATTTGSRVYVRDLPTAQTAVQSLTQAGAPATAGVEFGFAPDGSAIAFLSVDRIVPEDTDSTSDVYARGVSFAGTGPSIPNPGLTPGPPAKASFSGSKTSIRVSRKRSFKFSFRATASLKGTAVFESVKKVRTSRRAKVKLVQKSFTVPASGKVTLRLKLSKKAFRILKLNRTILTRVTVSLRNAAGLSSKASKQITLKAPKPKRRR